jgi:hypothetical protein
MSTSVANKKRFWYDGMDNQPSMNESVAESVSTSAELPRVIERGIDERTQGRVHELSVETAGDRLIIRGCVNSCHVKQLALDAVIEASDSFAIQLDIRVVRQQRGPMDQADTE